MRVRKCVDNLPPPSIAIYPHTECQGSYRMHSVYLGFWDKALIVTVDLLVT